MLEGDNGIMLTAMSNEELLRVVALDIKEKF